MCTYSAYNTRWISLLSRSLFLSLSLPFTLLHLSRTVTSLSSFLGNNNVHIMNGSPIPSATSMSPTQNGSNIMSVDGKRILCTADVRGKITLSIISGYVYGVLEYGRHSTMSFLFRTVKMPPLSVLIWLFLSSLLFRQHLASQSTRTRHQR